MVNFEAAQPDAVEITDDKMAGGIRGQTGRSPIANFLKLGNHFGQEARERSVCLRFPPGSPGSEKQVPPLRTTIRFAARCAPVGMTIWRGSKWSRREMSGAATLEMH